MSIKSNILKGKKGVVMGIANDRSIGWGIAQELHDNGAELAFTYQGDVFKKRVQPLAEKIGVTKLIDCEVTDEESMDAAFSELEKEFGEIDFLIHSIAFSDKNELKGRYVDTSLDNFLMTMNISCYSFTAAAKRAARIMKKGGSMISLSYYGAEKVMPNYNVMGVAKSALETSVQYMAMDLGCDDIRVNAVSAGPIKTLAASGIGDFKYILKWNEHNSPLKRNTSLKDVGGACVYLVSDLASGTTGEVLHVDSGYHVVGMKAYDAPDISTC